MFVPAPLARSCRDEHAQLRSHAGMHANPLRAQAGHAGMSEGEPLLLLLVLVLCTSLSLSLSLSIYLLTSPSLSSSLSPSLSASLSPSVSLLFFLPLCLPLCLPRLERTYATDRAGQEQVY